MYDVTGVNVFPRKLMKFPRKEKVNSVPYPTLYCFFPDSFKKCSTFRMSKESKSTSKCLAKVILSPTKEQLIVSFIDFRRAVKRFHCSFWKNKMKKKLLVIFSLLSKLKEKIGHGVNGPQNLVRESVKEFLLIWNLQEFYRNLHEPEFPSFSFYESLFHFVNIAV